MLGVTFHRVVDSLGGNEGGLLSAPEGSYALVAMSGLVAGVMQAPLTGIFLVMEVTRGFGVIPPLMIVSVLSLLVARRFHPYSLYTRELATSGDLLRPGTDRRILADLRVRETLDEEVTPVYENLSLAEFVRVARGSARGNFPVLRTGSEEYAGMLEVGLVRELLLDPPLARVTFVGTMARDDLPTLGLDDTLADALEVFEASGSWVLPVLDGKRFAGLLSKSTLFDHYRRELTVQTGPV
jgi:CIC family chloride channel protein